jgi:hypothetical protein
MCPAIQPCMINSDPACQKSQKEDDCFNRIATTTIRADKKNDQFTKTALLARLDQHKRDQKAARRATASAAVYDIDGRGRISKPASCLTLIDTSSESSLRHAEKALGLSPNSLRTEHFASEEKGYRAALFYDERDKEYVVAFRGTNKNNLIDWQNNINNQLPNATADQAPSYFAAKRLGRLLKDGRPPVDYTGHSKGGGEVFEALSSAPDSEAFVFNAAGPSPRIDAETRLQIAPRVQAYQVGGEMLNLMQDETDPARTIDNMKWLRGQVDSGLMGTDKAVKITERDNNEILLKASLSQKTGYAFNTTDEQKKSAAVLKALETKFANDKRNFIAQLDTSIAQHQANLAAGRPVTPFASVLGERRVLGGEPSRREPGIGALQDHTMEHMKAALDKQLVADRKALEEALPLYAPNFKQKVRDCTDWSHCD